MLNQLNIYKYFIFTILISPFLGFFSGTGIIAYGPLLLLLFLIIITEVVHPSKLKIKDWITILLWVPYVIWAAYYYISSPFQGRYLTTHSLVIITLPFLTFSFLRLRNNIGYIDYANFIKKIVLFFIIGELIICLGQISTYLFGFGFPVSEGYVNSFMVSGTFANSNDLGGSVLILSFIFASIESLTKKHNYYIWGLIALLLIISGSRSAIFIATIIFLLTRGLRFKNLIPSIILFCFLFVFFNYFISNSNNDVFGRFTSRFNSIFRILEGGIESDGSVNIRTQSYIHYLSKLPVLGLGSGEINQYYEYADGANFNTSLLFENPHSLIIEVSYWLGFPGLISFLIAITNLVKYSKKKVLLIVVLMISTLIPSSTIGSLIYFLFIICACFSSPKEFRPIDYQSNSKV